MKRHTLLSAAAAVAALVLAGTACETRSVDSVSDEELGLAKASVFATPDPIVAVVTAAEPGENETLEPYFDGAPPLIPHDVSELLPIRLDENLCLGCHDMQDMIGEGPEPGDPTPIPASHYTDLRRRPGEVTRELIGARYVCTLCHAPQLDVAPLVENTYTR